MIGKLGTGWLGIVCSLLICMVFGVVFVGFKTLRCLPAGRQGLMV